MPAAFPARADIERVSSGYREGEDFGVHELLSLGVLGIARLTASLLRERWLTPLMANSFDPEKCLHRVNTFLSRSYSGRCNLKCYTLALLGVKRGSNSRCISCTPEEQQLEHQSRSGA